MMPNDISPWPLTADAGIGRTAPPTGKSGGPAADANLAGTASTAGHGVGADDAEGLKIALIDTLRFSCDCLILALRASWPQLRPVAFASVEEYIEANDGSADVILFRSHDIGPLESFTLGQVASLRAAFPATPIILMSDSRNALWPATIRSVIDNGARGVIPTITTDMRAAVAAIRFVQAGGTYAPVDVLLHRRTEAGSSPNDMRKAEKLTSRQISVLAHLRHGKANKTIAYELGMAESTVKVHVRNIMRKLGATNRTQAVFKADQLWNLTSVARLAEPPCDRVRGS